MVASSFWNTAEVSERVEGNADRVCLHALRPAGSRGGRPRRASVRGCAARGKVSGHADLAHADEMVLTARIASQSNPLRKKTSASGREKTR